MTFYDRLLREAAYERDHKWVHTSASHRAWGSPTLMRPSDANLRLMRMWR